MVAPACWLGLVARGLPGLTNETLSPTCSPPRETHVHMKIPWCAAAELIFGTVW